MKNYLIQYDDDYGIYQTDKDMREVKTLFNENAEISLWKTLEELQEWAKEYELNYVGFDMFYK